MPNTSTHFISPLVFPALDGIIGVTFNGIAADGANGYSVVGAGDVNGDGIDDVLIGAPYTSYTFYLAGSTYLIFGHTGPWNRTLALESLNGINGVVITGAAAVDTSGLVARAGDVNGDGIDDLLIGARAASPSSGGLDQAGSTYLIFGHTGPWDSTLALGSLNGTNGVVINGAAAYDYSGLVGGAGDVNGDGIDDLLIGALGASPGNLTWAGSTYLIFGHTGPWNSSLSLSTLDGTNGVVINGVATYDRSGCSVAGAGDVNGDGISDVVIGADNTSFGGLYRAGSAYLIFGHTGPWNSILTLGSLNGTNGVVINGIASNDWTGFSVAGAGDVNGDGFGDLLIGAHWASPEGLTYAGSTYLIFGHAGFWSSPLVLEGLNGINGVTINGMQNDYSGWSVAGAGDVNGDGISDVLISSEQTFGGPAGSGSTYLIFGYRGTWNSSLSLSTLDGTNGSVINSVEANDRSGQSVAGAGDVNGDGLDDVLVGAYFASPEGYARAGSTYLIFGDSLNVLINNSLTIDQGQTIVLNNSMLAAYCPYNSALNPNILFRVTNVRYGTFSTLNFLQSALSEQLVSFTHDGSIYAPSFEVTIGHWAPVGPIAATINFDAFPIININSFSVGQGQTVVLTNQAISAISLYFPADELMFNVSNVLHGNFVQTNTTTIENQFNQSALTWGQIAFATDGSGFAPSYDISVSDGRLTTPAIRGTVNFKAAPVLLNNRLTLTPGQQQMILSANDLSASNTAIPTGELAFTPSTLNCHFENINLPGTALSLFLQQNVQGNQILFVWDGYTPPAYNISVSDGVLSAGGPALITITPASSTSIVNTQTTDPGAIIGGVVAASAIGLIFFGLQRYLKKRTNEQLQIILLEGISDAEKAFSVDVVRPIADKIFDTINTTGFLGQRTETATKEYMMAINKIISELKYQGADLNLNAMEDADKEIFLSEIANQTRQQSLPKRKGFFGSCARCFKAEANPQEIEYAAKSIASAAVAWQKRHMDNVSTTSANLGLELGKLSNVGFSAEAANEDIPPEKQFQWMQNHLKMLKQQEQEQQQELKRLEEEVLLQEAELTAFRR